MNMLLLRSSGLRALALGAVLLFAAAPVLAAEQAGRVLTASGTVLASTVGGGTRVLTDGSRVYAGERIETRDGRVQVLFIDGALMTLEPDTLFLIEAYEQRDPAAGDADDGGTVLMNLLRGGLRTISGSIGGEEGERYELKTPPATVGIRGTQFSLQYCSDGGCGEGVPDGLYGHVGEGAVTVDNEGGGAVFGSGSFFRVAGIDERPVPILRPPGAVLRGERPPEDDGGQGGAGTGDGESGGALAAAPRADDDDRRGRGPGRSPRFSESERTGNEIAGGNGGNGGGFGPGATPLDAAVAVGFIGAGPPDGGACTPPATGCFATVDPDGNLDSARLEQGGSTFEVGSGSTLLDQGGLPAFEVVWGRWAGDIRVDGAATGGDLLWGYSTNATTSMELGDAFKQNKNTLLQYNLAAGPDPISARGSSWGVSSLSVTMLVNLNGARAEIGQNGINLTLTGPGSMVLTNPTTLNITPGTARGGFETPLSDFTGGLDEGSIEGQFIGDRAGGMLVGFEARDVDVDGGVLDTVRGVKVLTK